MIPLTLLFVEGVPPLHNSDFRDRPRDFFKNLLVWCGKEKDGRQNGVGDEHRDDRHDHRAGR
jgi:hypothetical protein